jgi:tetratricopeptide (TPR) repeat protein
VEIDGLDEEFVYHLDRGTDLLARGDAEAARAALERARALYPRNPRALGLLGQALYKLARFDDAAEVYSRLVDESPAEASARVNLGLASLKARRYPEAVRQLEIALDLSPDHKKAMGYLGLAWLEQGEFASARVWFHRAGSEQMVARCEELIANATGAVTAPRAPAAAPPAASHASPDAGDEEPTPPASPAGAAEPPGDAPAPPTPSGPPRLPAFTTARLVGPTPRARFSVGRGLLTVQVSRDALVRAQGLLAALGAVRLVPEMKRFRGQATQKPYGDGPRRMLRASGEGALLYRAPEGRLSALEMAGEAAYFREEAVFAFEDAVSFDNGRVASRLGPDLNLVHLRGDGEVLLVTLGEILAVQVSRDAPARVPEAALVGWTGALTPRIAPLAERADAADVGPGDALVVELSGDGRVLVDQGAAA